MTCTIRWCVALAQIESQYCAGHQLAPAFTPSTAAEREALDAIGITGIEECEACDGSGECACCEGQGYIGCSNEHHYHRHDCDTCGSDGKCQTCQGVGYTDHGHVIEGWDEQTKRQVLAAVGQLRLQEAHG